MNIKPIIFATVALLTTAVPLMCTSCGDSIQDKIENSIKDERLSLEDYDRLAEEYKNEKGDTSNFYVTVLRVFDDNAYSPTGIRFVEVPAKVLPTKVTVYLDNTSSMMGYIKPKAKDAITTDFTDVFTRGIGHYYANDTIEAVYVNKPAIGKGASLARISFDQMSSQLTSKQIVMGDAFTMDALLDSVITTAATDTLHNNIAFIVTDGILSGTNEEIARDRPYRKFNINNKGLLQGRINKAVKKAHEKGYGAAIYQFNANYDGDYYKYNNFTDHIKVDNRPFYLVAIGDRSLIEDFTNDGIKNFKPVDNHSMVMLSSVGSLIPIIQDADCDNKNVGNVVVIEIKPDEGKVNPINGVLVASLHMSFSLDRFPEYMRELDALKNGLKITVDGEVLPTDTYEVKGKSLSVPFKVESGSEPSVEITLTDVMPGWVMDITSSDDSAIKNDSTQQRQTFLFNEFVGGIKSGIYNLRTPDLGSVRFQIDWESGETN